MGEQEWFEGPYAVPAVVTLAGGARPYVMRRRWLAGSIPSVRIGGRTLWRVDDARRIARRGRGT
jgi:hypothetical protein